MKSAVRAILFGALLGLLPACGSGCFDGGPFLYFVEGPSAARGADDFVTVHGQLWSVVQWPAEEEFCVSATWDDQPENTSRTCSKSAVPPTETSTRGFSVALRSAKAVAAMKPGGGAVSIDISVTSDFNDNKGKPGLYSLDSP